MCKGCSEIFVAVSFILEHVLSIHLLTGQESNQAAWHFICMTCYWDLGGMCIASSVTPRLKRNSLLCRDVSLQKYNSRLAGPKDLFTFKATANNSHHIYILFILSNQSVTPWPVRKCNFSYFSIYSDFSFNLSPVVYILKKGLKLSTLNSPLPPLTSLTIAARNTLLQVQS